jgi:hypothetical protein
MYSKSSYHPSNVLLLGFFFFILVCILQCVFFVIIYKRKPNSYMQGHPCEAIGWHEFLEQSEEVELFGRNRSDGSPIRVQPQNYLFANVTESPLSSVLIHS